MPKYYFDILDGEQTSTDNVGIDLVDDTVARHEATKTITEIVAQEILGDGDERRFRIVVYDSDRTLLFEVRIEFHSHPPRHGETGEGAGTGGNDASRN